MARPASRRKPVESTEESIVHALFDLASHLARGGERLAAASGLTTQQWIVLLQIAGDPNFPNAAKRGRAGVLPSEIAAARGVSRATVSVVVSALLQRGLIAQLEDDGDLRRKRLVPTAAGHRVVSELTPIRRAANRRLFGPLDPHERQELLRLLRMCLASLDSLTRARHARGPKV